jgi:oxalate decarboxylase/phosphoglucose isomerase-like protein (cupin superfamily)
MEDKEGPYECWYIVLEGVGEVRTEFGDYRLEKFDAAFMPPGASHQMRNAGTTPVWWATLSSRGGYPLVVDTYGVSCSEQRPGYMEEYERIMAERKRRGLPTP